MSNTKRVRVTVRAEALAAADDIVDAQAIRTTRPAVLEAAIDIGLKALGEQAGVEVRL